jgi:transposase
MKNPYTKSIDHHGLVAGFCKEIGLVKIIDDALGGAETRKVSFGKLFVAMMINGLGFTSRSLHMYSEYFSDKALGKLIDPDIDCASINDDALGRCLDRLFEYGVSSLYQDIAEKVVDNLGIKVESVHLDSTSFHYDGTEKLCDSNDDIAPQHIEIRRGYSRDYRPELNQVVLNLICENKAGIPLFMKAASGNINDLEGFNTIVKSHIKSLKGAQECAYFVGDAALYVKDTIVELDKNNTLFITRVPKRLKEAKLLINGAEDQNFLDMGDGYSGAWTESNYGEIKQKWLLIRSEQARRKEMHNLDKRILKATETSRKSFKKLSQERFACEKDALKSLASWQKKQQYSDVSPQILKHKIYTKKGQPKKDAIPKRVEFQITGHLFTILERKEEALKKLGYFILATNDTTQKMTMELLLRTYKAQQSVENGFRFLKSPDFFTSAIFLKKPERIEALLMVVTSCLMIYASLEHKIRKQLKSKKLFFPDMKKKPYQKPTARWVFQCFQGISIIYSDDKAPLVVNLQDRQRVILECLGDTYQEFYS